MDIEGLNRAAWDKAVEGGDNPYTRVVSPQQVADARAGSWAIQLSELRTVPPEWFPPLSGLRVLCLAGGGGQQAPILAAAGAEVTLLDGSTRQLGQDAFVAERDGLTLRLVHGDMADLSAFADASFDLVVNPVSTLFVPDVRRVWRECRRVLVDGGVLITGFMNPDEFVFDSDALDERGEFVVRYPLPYVEHETLDAAALRDRIAAGEMFHFSHTMEAQLGGMIEAGFVLTGFYEDRRTEEDGNPIRFYLPSQFVVRAVASGMAEATARASASVAAHDQPTARLHALADAYLAFTRDQPHVHDLANGPTVAKRDHPWLQQAAIDYWELLHDTVAACQPDGTDEAEILRRSAVTWATVYGISRLSTFDQIPEVVAASADELVHDAIEQLSAGWRQSVES